MEEITVTKDGSYQIRETTENIRQGYIDQFEFDLSSINATIDGLNERLAVETAKRDAIQEELDVIRQKVAEANGKASWAEFKEGAVEPVVEAPL